MISEKINQLFANTLNAFAACFPDDDHKRRFDGNPDQFSEAEKLRLSRYFLETLHGVPLLEEFDHVHSTALDVLAEIDDAQTSSVNTGSDGAEFSNDYLPGGAE